MNLINSFKTELFTKRSFFDKLYPEGLIFDSIEVSDLEFSYNGPSIIFSLHTNILPSNIPEKWGKISKVRFELEFFDCEKINLSKWGIQNIGNIELTKSDNHINFSCKGDDIDIEVVSKWLFCKSISGYLEE